MQNKNCPYHVEKSGVSEKRGRLVDLPMEAVFKVCGCGCGDADDRLHDRTEIRGKKRSRSTYKMEG